MAFSSESLKRRLPIMIFLLYLISAAAAGAQDERGPDAWERRHNKLQPPDRVMDAIGVKPGMAVGEVGAGRGRYVVHMARRVGPSGKVYANDIDDSALAYLRERCARDTIENVVTILGTVTDPRLPAGALDLVYMINTYHHLEKSVELMRNIRPSLKPGGLLAIIEHDPVKSSDASGESSTSRDSIAAQAAEAGFELVRIETFLQRDNINIFRSKAGAKPH